MLRSTANPSIFEIGAACAAAKEEILGARTPMRPAASNRWSVQKATWWWSIGAVAFTGFCRRDTAATAQDRSSATLVGTLSDRPWLFCFLASAGRGLPVSWGHRSRSLKIFPSTADRETPPSDLAIALALLPFPRQSLASAHRIRSSLHESARISFHPRFCLRSEEWSQKVTSSPRQVTVLDAGVYEPNP